MDEQPQQDSSTASVPQGDTSTSPSQSIDPIEKNVSHRHGSFSQRPPLFSLAIAALIMIAGLGAGLMFMKQSQDVRSRATVTGTMLALSPGTATAAVGATIPIGVTINTDTDTVSAVVLSLSYDPTAIQIVSFTPGTVLPVPLVAETHDNGAISVTLAAQPTTPFTGAGILGTWQVKILAAKQSSISFTSATQVAAVDKTGNALIASTGSSITGSTAPSS